MRAHYADFLIIGAGIVGLSIAKSLRSHFPDCSVQILEKESSLGCHASGRNSGVLHSGIYYPENSLKGKLCVEGAQMLRQYCKAHQLPLSEIGKVIVPVSEQDDQQLELLYKRGKANGAAIEMIDASKLASLEPNARSASGRALYSPHTAVFDPMAILSFISKELTEAGVLISFRQHVTKTQFHNQTIHTREDYEYRFGHLINTAGLHADSVARQFKIGEDYALIPFKGLYYELSPTSRLSFNGLIYPVPDLRVPFLGVHFTKSISGKIYAGPTAIPAFGRENYQGFKNIDWLELPGMVSHLINQYRLNHQGFRTYTHQEAFRFFKRNFVQAAQALVPTLKSEDLVPSAKVGIRPQLLHIPSHSLVMDFLVEMGPHSTHILNAVSPAFTSAFAFAEMVVNDFIANSEN